LKPLLKGEETVPLLITGERIRIEVMILNSFYYPSLKNEGA